MDSEATPNPELTRAKQTIKELQAALDTAEVRIIQTEARAIVAEQRFARLFAEEKRQRILAASERWRQLPAASIAIIASASSGFASEVLKEKDGRR